MKKISLITMLFIINQIGYAVEVPNKIPTGVEVTTKKVECEHLSMSTFKLYEEENEQQFTTRYKDISTEKSWTDGDYTYRITEGRTFDKDGNLFSTYKFRTTYQVEQIDSNKYRRLSKNILEESFTPSSTLESESGITSFEAVGIYKIEEDGTETILEAYKNGKKIPTSKCQTLNGLNGVSYTFCQDKTPLVQYFQAGISTKKIDKKACIIKEIK
jgi:hypothetical protein